MEQSRAEATVEAMDKQHIERYALTLPEAVQALGDFLREPWLDEWRTTLEDLRKKLRRFGEVNTGAIKEYEEVQAREKNSKPSAMTSKAPSTTSKRPSPRSTTPAAAASKKPSTPSTPPSSRSSPNCSRAVARSLCSPTPTTF